MRIYPFSPTCDIVEICNNSVDEELICSICLNCVNKDNIFLDCDHLFHPECIVRWFKKQVDNSNIPSCPMCKKKYDANNFANKIFSYHIQCIEKSIDKLNFVLKNGSFSNIDKILITKLLKGHKICNSTLKNEINKYSKNPNYLDCKIKPIPYNILQLIRITEQQVKEKQEKQEKEGKVFPNEEKQELYKKLLPKQSTFFCNNIAIFFRTIFKC